ncbi:N-acyl homoserine lactonase family protein [Arthrobacter sp. NPDC093128]|uniref:N-acyl homoserine lactonase AhlD n=1 Tax=Arthrobacter sp. NPDC093128 TaxID=3154979 RepID=UPI0034272687
MAANQLKVHVLETGVMEADMAWLLLKPGRIIADRHNKERKREWGEVPTHAVLIEHPEGLILWDTGVPRDWASRWASSGMHEYFPVTTDTQGESGFLDSSLAQLGLAPTDIDLLILSHLHLDHAGNARLFDNGKTRIVANRKELEGVRGIMGDSSGGHLKADFEGLPIEGIEGDTEIVPGVSVIDTPGHTWGTMSLQVDLPDDGTKIFTSDAVYLEDSFGPPAVGAAIVWNNLLWLESVEKLRKIAERTDAEIIFGHETAQVDQIRWAPAGHYQ